VLESAKNNGVTVLTFPLHSTNKLQPLDGNVFKTFKIFNSVTVDSWLMQHYGQNYSISNFAACINTAHKAVTPAKNVAAFYTMGIFPYDRDIFTEADFVNSFVADKPSEMLQEQEPVATNEESQEQTFDNRQKRFSQLEFTAEDVEFQA
jgi:hypothetical protein